MSTKARPSRRFASPISSRTRASPSNGLTEPTYPRSASAPVILASRTTKTSRTPPRRLPNSPPELADSPAIISLPNNPPTIPAELTPRTITPVRQAIRAQYSWEIPLDTDCRPYVPKLPTWIGETIVTVKEARLYNIAFSKGYLGRISYLQIILNSDTHTYSLDPGGKSFPFRGQGPIWNQNSCHIDVCIVAARLLNVGSTIADRGIATRDSWLQALPPVQRQFLRLISADWENMDRATNASRRHQFWDLELAPLEGILPRNNFGSAFNVWSQCTSQMGQFGFERKDGLGSCKNCGSTAPPKPVRPHQYLSLDMSKDQYEEYKSQFGQVEKPINYWIDREFKPSDRRCGSCKTPNGRSPSREIVGTLPPRLVVVPGPHVQGLISAATSDYVQISYRSSDREQKATYRWLGGIYYRQKHFRLYWTDSDSLSPEPQLRVYDGKQAFGAIIGGISAFSPEDMVPPAWSQSPTVLFYERIDIVALETAARSISAHIDSALASALSAEIVGAQAPGSGHTQSDEPQDNQPAIEDAKEEEARDISTEQKSVLTEEAEDKVSGPGSNKSGVLSDNKQPPMIDSTDCAQPEQQGQEPSKNRADKVGDACDVGDVEAKVDSKSLVRDPDELEDEVEASEEDKGASDHDDGPPNDDQDQSKKDDTDDENEANGGEPPEDSSSDHQSPGSPRPPKSPSKTPPHSSRRSPKTPPPRTPPSRTPPPRTPPPKTPPPKASSPKTPPQTQKGGLFSGFSTSRLFGLFTPLRSGAKSEPPPAIPHVPSPTLHQENENIDPFADGTQDESPLTSSDDNLSIPDIDSEPEAPASPFPPTPPITPAKKRFRIIPLSTVATRHSQRNFKPRSSGRMAQMIPMNTRTAGSMGPYKPLPSASRRVLVATHDGGGRGRSTIRMSSVVVGQKRSSSASSISSTGSSAGSYSGRAATKRVRFATMRG
ncbi:MAG: hypothetical protein Q9169_003025 [Polycauliona sp. 2 TL-2023]